MASTQIDRLNFPLVPVRIFSGPGFAAQIYLTDEIIEIDNGTTTATVVTLPDFGGGPYTIVDGAGAAAAHPIVIQTSSGLVIGTIGVNGGSLTVAWDGSVWVQIQSSGFSFLSNIGSLANIAALRARTGTLLTPTIYLQGYYAADDGGGGHFIAVTTDTTSLDDGGSIIVDGSGTRWYRDFGGEISIRHFGCKGDLSTDCSAQLAACFAYAAGRTIHAPVGQYAVHSTVTYAGPLNLRGDGNGCGPGPAAISNSGCTQFLLYGSATGLFGVTTNSPCTFRAFQVNVEPGSRPHAGTGISIAGAGSAVNANSIIDGVGFSNVSNPILYTRMTCPKTQNCYFDSWIFAGMYIQTSAGIEGGGGDISGNFFFGPASESGTQGPAIDSEVGYVDIHDNLFTGGAGAVNLNFRNFPAGAPLVHDNVIEDYRLYGVSVSTADGNVTSMVRIHDNEFSNVAFTANKIADILVQASGADYIVDLQIRGNVIRSVGAPTSSFINVQSGQNVMVSDNVLDNLGAAVLAAISVFGGFVSNTVAVRDNQLRGTYTTKYILQNITVLRDMTTSLAVAELTTWGNGSEVYVGDGHATNVATPDFTVIAGGTGCIALRMSGAWLTIQV